MTHMSGLLLCLLIGLLSGHLLSLLILFSSWHGVLLLSRKADQKAKEADQKAKDEEKELDVQLFQSIQKAKARTKAELKAKEENPSRSRHHGKTKAGSRPRMIFGIFSFSRFLETPLKKLGFSFQGQKLVFKGFQSRPARISRAQY
eukprot:gene8491-397_t